MRSVPAPLSPQGIGKLHAHSRAVYHLWAAMRDPDLPPARRKQIRALLTDEEIEAIRAIYLQVFSARDED